VPSIAKRVEIVATPPAVWAAVADYGAVDAWAPTIARSWIEGDVARGAGAVRVFELRGSRRRVRETIDVWVEGRAYSFHVDRPQAPFAEMAETWIVEALGAGTRARVTLDYSLRGGALGAVIDRLAARRRLDDILSRNLAGLKLYVESGNPVETDTPSLPLDAVEDAGPAT
jgi:hypothetical protein